ncbi:hypothetical protein [Pseudolysinimonas sp.]|jgi:hypothetical protein|uniref:hypothetical protein n=1 Tax=Pseudolysinimonas sp. TaxID=2680009 RepID=UPI003783B830
MTGALQTRRNRALGLAEKTILGFIAGAATAIGVVEIVFLVGRIIAGASGPVTLSGVPTTEPLDAGFGGATFDTVTLMTDLTTGGRAAFIAAGILTSLLTLGICAVVVWLCLRVFVGKPFVGSATWGIGIVAILVVVVALGRPALLGVANAEAAAALDLDQLPVFLVAFDPAPIGWAFALMVVTAAFEIGQRLQRDTEALV